MSKKEISNLTEAFQALNNLNEEAFNINNIEDIKEAQSLVWQNLDKIEDEPTDVIDTSAEDEDELKDSYKDKVVEECSVCHTKRFIDPEDVVLGEDGTLANIGDECEFCHSNNGYTLVGKVEPYLPSERIEVKETEKEDTEDSEETEDEEKEEVNLDGDDFTLVVYEDKTDKKSYADPLEADSAFAELKELSDNQLEEQKILGFARITRDDEDKLVIDDVVYAHVDDDCEEKVNSEIDEFIERKHDSEDKLDLDSEDEEKDDDDVIEDTEEDKSEIEEIEDETEEEIDESLIDKKHHKKINESADWNYFDKFNELLEKYMPDEGEGETMANQLATAINKLIYKWYNDGDVFDNTHILKGWANDLSTYANWIYWYLPTSRDILDRIKTIRSESEYEDLLKDLADKLLNKETLEKYDQREKIGSIYEEDYPFKFEEYSEEDEDDDYYDESLKSKKLDDIDADMDDKKEKAKKVYARKIDDADTDRDDRISRAKAKREKSIDDADSDRDYHLRKHDMKEDKTSLRDRIDAEADDKKELAKKRFERTKDDARADRDYKVKKLVKEDFNELADLQHDVDYEMETIKHISPALMNKIKRAGLSLVKDQYGEYEVIDKVEPVHENIEDKDIEVDLETEKPIHEKINKSFCERHPEMREHKHIKALKEYGFSYDDQVSVFELPDEDYDDFDIWHDYIAEDEMLYGKDGNGLIIDGGRDFKSYYFVTVDDEEEIRDVIRNSKINKWDEEETLNKLKEITGKEYIKSYFIDNSTNDKVDIYYSKDDFNDEKIKDLEDAYMGNYKLYRYQYEDGTEEVLFIMDHEKGTEEEKISRWIQVPPEKIKIKRISSVDKAEPHSLSHTRKPDYEIDESKKLTKRLHKNIAEDFDKVEIETKDQRIKIESEPICEPEEECGEESEENATEVIAPIDAETADKFKKVDVDIDEIDEESSDEIIESYLRKVYENVKSYKTLKGTQNKNQMKLEGLITFKSGKQVKTDFIFESRRISKNNKLEFLGENKQFTKGKKAFKLIGKAKNGKLTCESLTYNYKGKDSRTGLSQRVYGRVVR